MKRYSDILLLETLYLDGLRRSFTKHFHREIEKRGEELSYRMMFRDLVRYKNPKTNYPLGSRGVFFYENPVYKTIDVPERTILEVTKVGRTGSFRCIVSDKTVESSLGSFIVFHHNDLNSPIQFGLKGSGKSSIPQTDDAMTKDIQNVIKGVDKISEELLGISKQVSKRKQALKKAYKTPE